MVALASPLQDVIWRTGFAAQGTWPFRGTGALGPSCTSPTTLWGKADVHPRMARFVLAIGPDATHLSLGARHPVLVSIEGKVRDVKAFACLRLPGHVHPHWSNDLSVILVLTVDQDMGVHVPSIHSIFLWQEVFGCQSSMDGRVHVCTACVSALRPWQAGEHSSPLLWGSAHPAPCL